MMSDDRLRLAAEDALREQEKRRRLAEWEPSELESIVRALAGDGVPTARDRDEISEWCSLCGNDRPEVPHVGVHYKVVAEREAAVDEALGWHAETCPWRRARTWVLVHPEPKPQTFGDMAPGWRL